MTISRDRVTCIYAMMALDVYKMYSVVLYNVYGIYIYNPPTARIIRTFLYENLQADRRRVYIERALL